MSLRIQDNAKFNYAYLHTLDTIGSGLFLRFDQRGQFKRIKGISLSVVSNVSGGLWDVTPGDTFIRWSIIKGDLIYSVISSPPIPVTPPVGGGTPYTSLIDGELMNWNLFNAMESLPVNFNPHLTVDANSMATVWINNGYAGANGAQKDVNVSVTVWGEYIPIRNSKLTKEEYLNPTII